MDVRELPFTVRDFIKEGNPLGYYLLNDDELGRRLAPGHDFAVCYRILGLHVSEDGSIMASISYSLSHNAPQEVTQKADNIPIEMLIDDYEARCLNAESEEEIRLHRQTFGEYLSQAS